MISTSNLFADDKKEKYPMDIKMVKKIFLQVNFSPQKKIQNEHIIGMVTPLDIPIHPVARSPWKSGEQALSVISNVIVVTRCVNGSLFEVHQSLEYV